MKILKLLLLAVMPMVCFSVQAQDNQPEKGDFTFAITAGYNTYTGIAAPDNVGLHELAAPSVNWNNKQLMLGFETGWFVSDVWKLNLGGGLNFTYNPGYQGVPGTGNVANGGIPEYRAVAQAQQTTFSISTGADRYLQTGVDNLMWYVGGRLGFVYGMNAKKYDEMESMGISVAKTWNVSLSAIMGIDYFVLPGMYVGAQISPLSYTYGFAGIQPQSGLKFLQADNHNFGLLAAPTLKLGFKF